MYYLENNQKVNTYHEKHKEAALRILSPEMTTLKEQWAPPWILVPRFSKLDLPRCGLFQNCIFFYSSLLYSVSCIQAMGALASTDGSSSIQNKVGIAAPIGQQPTLTPEEMLHQQKVFFLLSNFHKADPKPKSFT